MLDLIFPGLCPSCESPSKDRRICESCLKEISFIEERALCWKCGVPFQLAQFREPLSHNAVADPEAGSDYAATQDVDPETGVESARGHLCGRCLQGEYCFDRARSVAYYDGRLRDMLHKFKYGGRLGLGSVLSAILSERCPLSFRGADLILPVPLHPDKLRKREYNQSVILAQDLVKDLGIPIDPFVLSKVRETRPQFEITNERERRRNVKGVFSVVSPAKIERKSVVLIDDVFTTGWTVDECARVLLQAGAYRVEVLTLMRAQQR